MKRYRKPILAVLAAVLLLGCTVFAWARSGLGSYLAGKAVGTYYQDLVDTLDAQYGFTDAQNASIRADLDEIIGIVKDKNPSFLESPQKFSGNYTELELRTVREAFGRMMETAGFYSTSVRNAKDDGDVIKVFDKVDDRLLLTIETEDRPAFAEPSSEPQTTNPEPETTTSGTTSAETSAEETTTETTSRETTTRPETSESQTPGEPSTQPETSASDTGTDAPQTTSRPDAPSTQSDPAAAEEERSGTGGADTSGAGGEAPDNATSRQSGSGLGNSPKTAETSLAAVLLLAAVSGGAVAVTLRAKKGGGNIDK